MSGSCALAAEELPLLWYTYQVNGIRITRLRAADLDDALHLLSLMAEAFEEHRDALSTNYLEGLLKREDFWLLAAYLDGVLVGGLTAHTLPMTRAQTAELFIYDLAVDEKSRRNGVGRRLVEEVQKAAAAQGIACIFVPTDNEDEHALDFYRAIGGKPSPVTFFTFGCDDASPED